MVDSLRIGKSDTLRIEKSRRGKSLIVIPARMASKRLPGKPLLMAGGQALVHWTYAQAKQTKADHVVIATPDREIANYCQENGLTWMTTAEDHPNGTSRCWEIVSRSKVEFDVVVNLQTDEPCVSPEAVDFLITKTGEAGHGINTVIHPDCNTEQSFDINTTKVVFSNGKCHWFSRGLMRGAGVHVGAYSFTTHKLSTVTKTPSKYAEAESLEQLTWIEAGEQIGYVEVDKVPLSINTEKDWKKFKEMVE
jgi:3-deoxy-manno-octulosonate cytidylyltransferase (CMP-KDO synthetase)